MTLIVIEGTDGSGKGTHTRLLIEWLATQGIAAKTLSFPTYGTPSCRLVEQYLNGAFGDVDPYTASIFYAFNRKEECGPMARDLAAGATYVLNRYVGSNIGHQGGKIASGAERKSFIAWLLDLEYVRFGIPEPTLTIFLDMPPEIGQLFVDTKTEDRTYLETDGRDLHEADAGHLAAAHAAYAEAAASFGWRIVRCEREDADQTLGATVARVRSLEEIQAEIRGIVAEHMRLSCENH